MSFWKKMPYWLKGGMIGALAGLLFAVFVGESCISFECYLVYYGPGLIMIHLFNFLSKISSEKLFDFLDSMIFWRTAFVTSLALCGIVIGLLATYIRSRWWLKEPAEASSVNS